MVSLERIISTQAAYIFAYKARITALEIALSAYRDPERARHTVAEEDCSIFKNGYGHQYDTRCDYCKTADELLKGVSLG